jgi:hypothetical protein
LPPARRMAFMSTDDHNADWESSMGNSALLMRARFATSAVRHYRGGVSHRIL